MREQPSYRAISATGDPPMASDLDLVAVEPALPALVDSIRFGPDGHQTVLWSQCAFESQFRFLADPSSVLTTTLCPR